jgi:chitinase
MHRPRVAAVLAGTTVAALAATAMGVASAGTAAPQRPAHVPAHPMVAPYLDMSGRATLLYRALRTHGLPAFSTGFVLGHGCTPIWDTGTTTPVAKSTSVNHIVTKAHHLGATPIISFGGAAPPDLATSCRSVKRLTRDYRSVLRRFHTHDVDFDVEGASLATTGNHAVDKRRTAANVRRFKAIHRLETANRHLVVSLTVPTTPTGINPSTFSLGVMPLLHEAKHAHARIDLVNLMTMDYFDGQTTEMGKAAISAAKHALPQLRTVWRHTGYRNLGITPMIGLNDDTSETFTLADAQTVTAWAVRHHIGRLAFWSMGRDRPCASSTTTAQANCSSVTQSALRFTDTFDNAP